MMNGMRGLFVLTRQELTAGLHFVALSPQKVQVIYLNDC